MYCGARADSRDHLPSKVLLDEPYPPQLLVVGACKRCNTSFSLDEQYLACFLECVICGGTESERVGRSKVKRILDRHPYLAKRINRAQRKDGTGYLLWKPEPERICSVVVKLARGHATYELYPQSSEPIKVHFTPLDALSEEERSNFRQCSYGEIAGWPEFGTRAFYRASGVCPDRFEKRNDWVVVQPGRYRYAVAETDGTRVRMVLSEYLACEVVW